MSEEAGTGAASAPGGSARSSLDSLRLLLVCPACEQERSGQARIGNRKSTCPTCNRFAQAVRRKSLAALALAHPEEFTASRYLAEIEVYASLFPDRLVGSTDGAPEESAL